MPPVFTEMYRAYTSSGTLSNVCISCTRVRTILQADFLHKHKSTRINARLSRIANLSKQLMQIDQYTLKLHEKHVE